MDDDTADLLARSAALITAVNRSAALVRALYLSFLLLGAYVGVTIGGTTHEQLLKVSPVTLPILNVDLPVMAFYAVVPWLLVLFHFNLLLQLFLLSRQLRLFNEILDGVPDKDEQRVQRLQLFPFPLVQLLAGQRDGPISRGALVVMVWVTLVWMPLALIVAAQIAFLPYHGSAAIASERLAVLVDVALICAFWPLIIGSGHLRPLGVSAMAGRIVLILTGLGALAFSWIVAVLPGEAAEDWVAWALPAPAGADGAVRSGNLLTHWVFDGPNAPLRRNLDLPGAVLLATPLSAGEERDLRGRDSVARETVLEAAAGMSLTGRDLRFANFHGAILVHADLRGANLDGADLRLADLAKARLGPMEVSERSQCVAKAQKTVLDTAEDVEAARADFVAQRPSVCITSLGQGARLTSAQAMGADLSLANLEGADLRKAGLASTSLTGATLAGARLEMARLEQANLTGADLAGADFTDASANSAQFQNVRLGGTRLVRARLVGVTLSSVGAGSVLLDEADLEEATIDGVVLRGVRIKDAAFAIIRDTDLRQADLREAKFEGAVLTGSDLTGADLTGAAFDGADLTNATLTGVTASGAGFDLALLAGTKAPRANFTGARFRGALIDGARLTGAALTQADLRHAVIRNVEASGVNLRAADLHGAEMMGFHVALGDLRALRDNGLDADERREMRDLGRRLSSRRRPLSPRQLALTEPAAHDQSILRPVSRRLDADAPVLCDESLPIGAGQAVAACLSETDLDTWRSALLAAACRKPDIAAGLALGHSFLDAAVLADQGCLPRAVAGRSESENIPPASIRLKTEMGSPGEMP